MRTIHERIDAVRLRIQRQWMWQCLTKGFLIGGVVGLLLAVARLATAGAISSWWSVACVLAIPLVAVLFAAIRQRSMRAAAVLIDQMCQFKDHTQSTYGFMTSRAEQTAMHRIQMADTEARLLRMNPNEVAPMHMPRGWRRGIALSATAVLVAFFPGSWPVTAVPLVSNEVVLTQASRVERNIDELKRLQEEHPDADVEKLLHEMAAIIKQLQQPGVDPKEALAHLSEMEAALQEMQNKVADPSTEAQLQEIGKALSLADDMAAAGQAMSKGELDKAAEELAKLELPKLDRKTEKAVTEKLNELAHNNGDGPKRRLQESTEQVSQGLAGGDRSKFKDGVQGLAGECKNQGSRKKLVDLLRKQCQCLSECKSQCESECKNQGDSNKKGGTKAGLARSGNEPGDKTPLLKGKDQLNLTGQESQSGTTDVETTKGPEQEQEAVRQYRELAQKYEALNESALESESIPLGHRQTIRRYFELIRPQGNEGEPSETK